MTSKERMLTALNNETPDRLPVTSHHLMDYFLKTYMGGIPYPEFFNRFDMDAIRWLVPHKPDSATGDYFDPEQRDINFLESRRVASNNWRIFSEEIPDSQYTTRRYRFVTPKGELSMVLQSNEYTSWVAEYPVKEKSDIDLIGEFITAPNCDVRSVDEEAENFGNRGLVRGHICCFDVFGQPGTWQDAACIVGIERLILATYDDPRWVHELLKILQNRKKIFIRSLKGAKYDLLELGGGDASSTVISPKIFDQFVASYDSELIDLAREAGQRIVYHTCGGMMPLLERIADMKPDAMETFTPAAMGGDTNLAEAKRRIGDQVCMIGGFDQFHFFKNCSPEKTRKEVRRCFAEAGENGGYILCPSDHFFDAEPELIEAFADEARRCAYK